MQSSAVERSPRHAAKRASEIIGETFGNIDLARFVSLPKRRLRAGVLNTLPNASCRRVNSGNVPRYGVFAGCFSFAAGAEWLASSGSFGRRHTAHAIENIAQWLPE